VAGRALQALDVTTERVRAQVVRIVGAGDEEVAANQSSPFTPRSKKVLELSLREAKALGNDFIGTGDLLLGLVRENEGVAARVLLDFGLDAQIVRSQVLRMRSAPGADPSTTPSRPRNGSSLIVDRNWVDGVGALLAQLANEIRRELHREPDAGDLLLALSVAPETLTARALEALDVDGDALWGQLERLRRESLQAQERLAEQIEAARLAKERAIEAQEFDAAARFRDQERVLTEQKRAPAGDTRQTLMEVRRRLGLPTPPPDGPQGPTSE
jgi:ATP-dependent Clp protease ATP-binding subunit ClpA